jgi:hypothetical protein
MLLAVDISGAVRKVVPKGPWNCGQLGVVVDDGVDGVFFFFFSVFGQESRIIFEGREGRQTGMAIQFAPSRSESAIEEKSPLIALHFRAATRGLNNQKKGREPAFRHKHRKHGSAQKAGEK